VTAKYSMTRSVARSLCDSWASCQFRRFLEDNCNRFQQNARSESYTRGRPTWKVEKIRNLSKHCDCL